MKYLERNLIYSTSSLLWCHCSMRIGICLNYQNVAWHAIKFFLEDSMMLESSQKYMSWILRDSGGGPLFFPWISWGRTSGSLQKSVYWSIYLPILSRNNFASANFLTQLALAAATRNLLFRLIWAQPTITLETFLNIKCLRAHAPVAPTFASGAQSWNCRRLHWETDVGPPPSHYSSRRWQ